jgi:acetyltransferase-like isoleucine patch superfamily enzyme
MLLKKLYWKLKKYKLLKNARFISKNIVICDHFSINSVRNLTIEEFVYLGPKIWIDSRGGITIKRGTIIGPRVKIHSFNHNYENCHYLPYDEVEIKKPVIIGHNVWIGSDVIILPGTIIQEGVIVSSGSVVRGNLEYCGIYAGNPASLVKKRDVELYKVLKSKDAIYMKNKVSHT